MITPFQHQIEFQKFRKEFKNRVPCIMNVHDGCDSKPINSHTISRVALKELAEKGHLITPIIIPTKNLIEIPQKFLLKGIRYASTFPGFCSHHDHRLFKPIDSSKLTLNSENIRLLYMRALAHELFKKHQNFHFHEELFRKGLVSRNSYYQAFQNGTRIAIKILLNQLLEISEKNSELSYIYFKFDKVLPFSFSGLYGFNLEVFEKEKGTVYHVDDASSRNFQNSLTAVIPSKTGSYFILASLKVNKTEFPSALSRFSFASIDLVEFIFQFGIDKMENLFISPIWFSALPKSLQEALEVRFHKTILKYGHDKERPFENPFNNMDYKHARFTNSQKARNWYSKHFR